MAHPKKKWQRWLSFGRLIPLATITVSGTVGILSMLGIFQATPVESILLAVLALLAVDALTERVNVLEKIEQKLSTLTSTTGLKRRSEIPPLEEKGRDASEIVIVGVSLISLIPFSHFFESKLKQGCKLRFLLLDPNCGAVATWNLSGLMPHAKKDIERTLDNLQEIIQKEQNSRGEFEVRLSNVFLPFSVVAIDPSKRSGWMIIENHTYKRTLGERPHIQLTNSEDSEWFEFFRSQYEQLWEESHRWQLPDMRRMA